jgi:hypothetical protein
MLHAIASLARQWGGRRGRRAHASFSVLFGLLVSMAPIVPAQAASPADDYLRQDGLLIPLANSSTFVLVGTSTKSGCRYPVPEIRLAAGQTRWEIRAIGVDAANCRMLMEQGVPPDEELMQSGNSVVAAVGQADGTKVAGAVALTSVASGYATAWFEDVAHLHVTEDRTNIAWQYTGSCISSGSATGQWSWDSLFTLVSHGGTSSYNACRYFLGDTWSTMKSGLCPWTTVWTYYYHVRAYGWNDGSFGGNYDDLLVDNNCAPLFPKFAANKTG